MTIIEAIEALDSAKNNAYSRAEKIQWLSRLDRQVKLFMDRHEDPPEFDGYTVDTDPETTLLIPAPFDETYLRYMEAQIDYLNGEFTRFNNAISLHSAVMGAFEDQYRRTHMPLTGRLKYF